MAMSRQLAWRSVVEAYQTCNQKYARMMAHFDLTSSQFDVMLAIEALGDEAYPKQVAEGLLVTKSNVTSVTKRLLERKLIRQKANTSDKRSIRFELTPKGVLLLRDAKSAAKSFIDSQLAPFSRSEIELVGELMQRMRGHLESEAFDQSIQSVISQTG